MFLLAVGAENQIKSSICKTGLAGASQRVLRRRHCFFRNAPKRERECFRLKNVALPLSAGATPKILFTVPKQEKSKTGARAGAHQKIKKSPRCGCRCAPDNEKVPAAGAGSHRKIRLSLVLVARIL